MVGQQIGKYRVLDRIGRGGMGTVYRAIDETLHREVAIKVLNAELNDPVVARRFRAEAVTVARLNHPGIATIYELLQHEGLWLMVMEFVRGETLETLVSRKGPLLVEEAAEIGLQTLAALAHAHGLGVVHRDLKPANIMVTEFGAVKVMDFGIARVAGTEHLTNAGFMMGTPAYMAPEQVLGQDIDARADLYALGVVLFHLATGALPFTGNTPFEVAQSRLNYLPTPVRSKRADAPPWFEEILGIALSREPDRRFQTALDFRESIRRGLANLSVTPPAADSIPPELMVTAPLPISGGTSGVSGARPSPFASVMASAQTPQPSPTTVASVAPTMLSNPIPTSAALATPPATAAPEAPQIAETILSATPISVSAPAVEPAPIGSTATVPKPTASVPVQVAASDVAPVVVPAPAPAARRGGGLAIAAALVVIGGVGAWFALQPSGPAPAAPTQESQGVPTVSEPAQPEAAPAPAPIEVAPPSSPAPSTSVVPTPSLPAGRSGAATTSASGRGDVTLPVAPARAAAAGSRRDGAPPSPPAVADDALSFRGVRLLVVVGKKAEERDGTLQFGGGQVSVTAERGGAVLLALPYREISYAASVRARDPVWSVVLAAPPSNTDLPGTIFTGARNWLTLQSRSAFMIVRLNDADWRNAIDAVTARTGIPVARPAPGR